MTLLSELLVPEAESCLTCDAKMTADHKCDDTVDPKVSVPLVSSSVPQSRTSKVDFPPLPLCHYCCHIGSGQNPVHYHEQCLCSDKICSCQCYCTDEQVKHKLQFYPSGSSGIARVDAKNRPKAKIVAERRIGQWPIFPCTSEDCVQPLIH